MVELSELNLTTPTPANEGEEGSDHREPRRFLKVMNKDVKRSMENLMKHVSQGCLSDPPAEKVKMRRVNPKTGRAFTARSTGTNEVDNRVLNDILSSATVGIARAERVLADHYEKSNAKKRVKPLGEEEVVTTRTDKLLLLNCFAKSCGYDRKDLPAQGVTAPPKLPFKEYMGFQFDLPEAFRPVEASAKDADDDNGEEGLADLAELILATDGNTLPTIRVYETTLEAYKRLTRDQPWVPFKGYDKTDHDDVDKAEEDLFQKLRTEYSRGAQPFSARGYGRMSEKWDIEVAKRVMQQMEEPDSGTVVILIRRKTFQMLQAHYDDFCAHIRRTQLAGILRDPAQEELNTTLRNNRRNMAPQQAATNVQPIRYNQMHGGATPFGAPTVLNTQVAARAMTFAPRENMQMAPFALRDVYPNQVPRPAATNPMGPNYKRNKYCVVCGYSKRENLQLLKQFGYECKGNCGHEECSKCGMRVELHDAANAVGPYCKNAASESSYYNDWYKEAPKVNNQI
ncbi:hypothetical protein SEMRO_2110_G315010.1 [Seminavis robusta]|uniref:Uncharacterized protein n=1 Tax=Seminavis robusta TaxID=568900 RepID=A0A9N8HUL7_9STRA|nr:hypothetical protein SEMRO_2110_G315010.1 [Seminavis robusta]|eukprot:Sro2110_g315010.1 n/a (512) ;mRNA; r:10420-12099